MSDELLIKMGQRIKERRHELGMTMDELAEKCGYAGKGTMSHIEAGRRNIPTEKLKEIAKALDVTPQYLLGWEIEPATVSAEEKKILETVTKLYNLPKEKQDIILKLIDSMVE